MSLDFNIFTMPFIPFFSSSAGKYLGSTSLSQSDPVIDIDEVEAANNSIINGLANFDTSSWLNASNRDTRSCLDVGRGSLLKKEKNVRKLSGSMNRKPSTSSIFTKRGDNVKSPREPIAEIRSAAVFMNLPVDQRGGGWGSQAVCISSEKTEGNDPFNDSIAGSLCDDRSEDGLANAVNDDGEQGE